MTKILKVRKPSDYSSWVGQTDRHPLVSVMIMGKYRPSGIASTITAFTAYSFMTRPIYRSNTVAENTTIRRER